MRLEVKVLIPDVRLLLTNDDAVLQFAANVVADEVKSRLRRGAGAHGALPRGKTGGKPLIATGRLVNSIKAVPSKRRGRKRGPRGAKSRTWVVRATGNRPKDEVGAKKKRARAKTKAMRHAKVAANFSPLNARALRKQLKLSRLRVRTADTNAALAGILSVPPKDTRAKAGNRGAYRVFEATAHYKQLAARAAQGRLRARLFQVGTIVAAATRKAA